MKSSFKWLLLYVTATTFVNYRPVFSFFCKITKTLYNLILPECIGNKQLIISFLLQAIVSAPPNLHTPQYAYRML